jgi:DNA-binding HxlR family transcriptional regulator
LNVQVLQALAEEPMPLMDLRRAVGSPPQTTMRGHLRALTEIGVLERRRQNDFPGTVDYELSGPGRELLGVAGVLEAWLADSPEGAISLGNGAAKGAIKALVEGWSSTIIRALAARPLSLTELNRLISGLNYPSLERRLGALRLAGQIEACPGEGRSTPYAVTDWLRRAIAPLAVAARWERRHIPTAAAPIARIDVEATFLLAVPVLSLATDMSGSCRLAVELRNGRGDPHLAGVLVEVREGSVAACIARLQGEADAWVSGSTFTWLQAVIEANTDRFEIGGDCDLAAALFEGLHATLFGVRQQT